jgi:Cdc6-like AAA superfamily ATPase
VNDAERMWMVAEAATKQGFNVYQVGALGLLLVKERVGGRRLVGLVEVKTSASLAAAPTQEEWISALKVCGIPVSVIAAEGGGENVDRAVAAFAEEINKKVTVAEGAQAAAILDELEQRVRRQTESVYKDRLQKADAEIKRLKGLVAALKQEKQAEQPGGPQSPVKSGAESAFDLNFIPERLMSRADVAEALMHGTYPKILSGKPDVGKTVTAKWLASSFPEKVVYVQCQGSIRFSLAGVLGSLKQNNEKALAEFFSKNHGKVLILDDVQRMASTRQKELSNALRLLSDEYGNEKTVLITNISMKEFLGLLDEDVMTRYALSEIITLDDYSADQVRHIIRQRFEVAGLEVGANIVDMLAGYYVNGSASLRDILRILKSIHSEGMELNYENIMAALDNRITFKYADEFVLLPTREAIVLGAVAALQTTYQMGFVMKHDAFSKAKGLFNLMMGLEIDPLSVSTFNRTVEKLIEKKLLVERDDQREQGRPIWVKCAYSPKSVYAGFLKWVDDKYGLKESAIKAA